MEEGSTQTTQTTRGTHWTSNPLDEIEIQVGKDGPASLAPINVFVPFLRNAKETPEKV
jgi:hypothetical protein